MSDSYYTSPRFPARERWATLPSMAPWRPSRRPSVPYHPPRPARQWRAFTLYVRGMKEARSRVKRSRTATAILAALWFAAFVAVIKLVSWSW